MSWATGSRVAWSTKDVAAQIPDHDDDEHPDRVSQMSSSTCSIDMDERTSLEDLSPSATVEINSEELRGGGLAK